MPERKPSTEDGHASNDQDKPPAVKPVLEELQSLEKRNERSRQRHIELEKQLEKLEVDRVGQKPK